MALGSTQFLTEMSTKNISWGLGGGVRSWPMRSAELYQLHVPTVLKTGSLNLLETLGSVQACTVIALPFEARSQN